MGVVGGSFLLIAARLAGQGFGRCLFLNTLIMNTLNPVMKLSFPQIDWRILSIRFG
jgi:hypothetical protein